MAERCERPGGIQLQGRDIVSRAFGTRAGGTGTVFDGGAFMARYRTSLAGGRSGGVMAVPRIHLWETLFNEVGFGLVGVRLRVGRSVSINRARVRPWCRSAPADRPQVRFCPPRGAAENVCRSITTDSFHLCGAVAASVSAFDAGKGLFQLRCHSLLPRHQAIDQAPGECPYVGQCIAQFRGCMQGILQFVVGLVDLVCPRHGSWPVRPATLPAGGHGWRRCRAAPRSVDAGALDGILRGGALLLLHHLLDAFHQGFDLKAQVINQRAAELSSRELRASLLRSIS